MGVWVYGWCKVSLVVAVASAIIPVDYRVYVEYVYVHDQSVNYSKSTYVYTVIYSRYSRYCMGEVWSKIDSFWLSQPVSPRTPSIHAQTQTGIWDSSILLIVSM